MYVSNLVHNESGARHACSISNTISQEMFITPVLQLSLQWKKKNYRYLNFRCQFIEETVVGLWGARRLLMWFLEYCAGAEGSTLSILPTSFDRSLFHEPHRCGRWKEMERELWLPEQWTVSNSRHERCGRQRLYCLEILGTLLQADERLANVIAQLKMCHIFPSRRVSYLWLSTSTFSFDGTWILAKCADYLEMSGFQDKTSEFSHLGLWWCEICCTILEKSQIVLSVMHQQATPEAYLFAPLRGNCRFMMCTKTQMAYFQLHHPTSTDGITVGCFEAWT